MNTVRPPRRNATILQLDPYAGARPRVLVCLAARTPMESPAVDLLPATPEQAPALENLFELYAHDLSAAFELDVGDDGRFGAGRLARYWSEPERCFPFLIRVGGALG